MSMCISTISLTFVAVEACLSETKPENCYMINPQGEMINLDDLCNIQPLPTATSPSLPFISPFTPQLRKKCTDFNYQEEAQTYMFDNQAYYLDANNDGMACTSLPNLP